MASYAQYRAATEKLNTHRVAAAERERQLQVEQRATLPFLGDDIFVAIAAELASWQIGHGARDLAPF